MITWNDLPDILLTAVLAAGIAALLFTAYYGGCQDSAVAINQYMENNCICICGGGVVGPKKEDGWGMVGVTHVGVQN